MSAAREVKRRETIDAIRQSKKKASATPGLDYIRDKYGAAR
jgi:hypothetical protein